MNEFLSEDAQLDFNNESVVNAIKSMWTSWIGKSTNGKAALEELIKVFVEPSSRFPRQHLTL